MKFSKSIITCSLAVLTFLIAGCDNRKAVYSEHQELSTDLQWNKSDVRTFTIPITDNSKPYQFELNFRYATGYAYDKLYAKLIEVAPDGSRTIEDLEINVRDAKGEFIGDKGYDIIDLTYTIDSAKKFPEHGTYTYTLEQDMPDVDPLHYAMEIGLSLYPTE